MAADVHQTFAVRARPEDVRLRLIPAAATDGYRLIGELPNGFAVRRRRTPGWAVVLAVIFFPLGLAFILVKVDEVVTVALDNVYGGTAVTITVRASPGLQRALQTALAVYQPAGAAVPPPAGAHPPPPPPSQPEVPEEQPEVREEAPPPVPAAPPVSFPGGGLPGGLPGGGFPDGLAGGGPPGGLPPMPLGVPPPPPRPAEPPGEES